MKNNKQFKSNAKTILETISFIKTCLENGIKEDNTLWLFIKLGIGVSIPREVHPQSKNSTPQFKVLSDLFFERENKVLIMANRTGGKTFLIVGLLNLLNMALKKEYTITSSGAIEPQAKEGYRHFKKLLRSTWWVNTMAIESIQSRTQFINGSFLEVIVQSDENYNSKHPISLVIDEVDQAKSWTTLQEGFSMPMSKGGYRSQLIMLSTRKTATGIMQKLMSESKERGIKAYQWNIWDVVEKCTLKMKCEQCSIFSKCEGKARDGKGFYKMHDLKDRALSLDSTTWKSQWENALPPTSGNFYDFNFESHVISVKSFCSKHGIEYIEDLKPRDIIPTSWQRFCAIDWGFSDPLVLLAFTVDPLTDQVYVYKEFYQSKLSAIETLNAWQGMEKYIATGRMVLSPNAFVWNNEPFSFIVVDNSRPEIRTDINKIRGNKTPLRPITNKERNLEFSYERVKERFMDDYDLNEPKLIFFSNCENAIREHSGLRTAKNGLPESNQDDHTCDSVRYGLSRLWTFKKIAQIEKNREEMYEKLYG